MWLVVGLGNPGARYERTRHNIGFRAVEALASDLGSTPWKSSKHGGDLASASLESHRLTLLKPQEFMNLSGFAVSRVRSSLGIEIGQVIVLHDEIDLALGVIRAKTGGGHGGHNGLRSLIDQLGSRDFHRIRLGVGRGDPPRTDEAVAGWVLSDFAATEHTAVGEMVTRSLGATRAFIAGGLAAAQTVLTKR